MTTQTHRAPSNTVYIIAFAAFGAFSVLLGLFGLWGWSQTFSVVFGVGALIAACVTPISMLIVERARWLMVPMILVTLPFAVISAFSTHNAYLATEKLYLADELAAAQVQLDEQRAAIETDRADYQSRADAEQAKLDDLNARFGVGKEITQRSTYLELADPINERLDEWQGKAEAKTKELDALPPFATVDPIIPHDVVKLIALLIEASLAFAFWIISAIRSMNQAGTADEQDDLAGQLERAQEQLATAEANLNGVRSACSRYKNKLERLQDQPTKQRQIGA